MPYLLVFLNIYYYYQLFTTVTVDEPAPGLKTIFSFKVPDQRSGKVSLSVFSVTECRIPLCVASLHV